MAETFWTELSCAPFGDVDCARSPVLISSLIILFPSLDDDSYIYTFNTKSHKWIKHKFGDYQNIEYHAMCVSNDNKTLFIFDGWDQQILFVVNIDTMKVIKEIDMIWVGLTPSIISDSDNKKLIHIIGGSFNNKHIIYNMSDYSTNTLYQLKTSTGGLKGPGIVYVKHKNIWLLFHYKIPIHIFDLNTKKWSNTYIKLPTQNVHLNIWNFGYVLTLDQKYVILFAGYNCDHILIFDIEQMKLFKSHVKTPDSGRTNAVMTDTGDIHLFQDGMHYTINAKTFIISMELLIPGYFKQLNLDANVPMDIFRMIGAFYGDSINNGDPV
eukprot:305498_1